MIKPREALWKIDHTVCMNKDIKYNLDDPAGYKEGDYDPIDTDCKSTEEYCECYDSLDLAIDELEKYKDLEKRVGMDLAVFIHCLNLLDQGQFKYAYVSGEDADALIISAITPVSFYVDTINKCFVEINRPKEHRTILYFADYGVKWALSAKELKDSLNAKELKL